MAQVTIEYFLLFAALAAITLVSVSSFDDHVRERLQRFFKSAATCVGSTATLKDECKPAP